MKKTVLFSALALTASAFADDGLVAAAKKMDNMSQSKMNQGQMMSQVVLTSARPESDNGWYLFADALYWHADVGNADWATGSYTTSTNTTVTDHHLDFKWSWGFKAGLGVNIDHDMWDSNVYYTWFDTQNSNSVGLVASAPSDVTQGIKINLPTGDNWATAKQKWKIHFSMFDWELGRGYYVSKNLALRPHVGAKGGWIHQTRTLNGVQTQQGDSVNIRSTAKNDFWGVGPSAGVNTMWILGNAGTTMNHRFSLFGDFAGALMYGHFDNSFHQSQTSQDISGLPSTTWKNLNRNLAVSMLQAVMGLTWDVAFNNGKNHFMMNAGYEFQYWFKQNQYIVPVSDGGFSRYSDDLALQGVTVDFCFDF